MVRKVVHIQPRAAGEQQPGQALVVSGDIRHGHALLPRGQREVDGRPRGHHDIGWRVLPDDLPGRGPGMRHAIRLAEVHAAQHDGFRLVEASPGAHEVGYPSGVDIRTEFTDLLGEIEDEMRVVLGERDGHARPLYEMLAYHLGIDKREGPRGKRTGLRSGSGRGGNFGSLPSRISLRTYSRFHPLLYAIRKANLE